MKKYTLLISIILLTLAACKKDKSANPDEPEVDAQLVLLTSKSWKAVLVDGNPASNPSGNVQYTPTQACQLDNSHTFGIDNKLTVTTGPISCSEEDKDYTSNYTVNFEAKTLTLAGTTYKIAELSATRLKYYIAIAPLNGPNNLIYIFEH